MFQLSFHFAYHRCWLGTGSCFFSRRYYKERKVLRVLKEEEEEGRKGLPLFFSWKRNDLWRSLHV